MPKWPPIQHLEARLQNASGIVLMANRKESREELAAFLRAFSVLYPHLRIRLINMRHDETLPHAHFRQELLFDDGTLSYLECTLNVTKEGKRIPLGNTAIWSRILDTINAPVYETRIDDSEES